MAEQKTFLEQSSTRKTFKHVKSDSASLIVHRDSASFLSRYTDSLSRLSLEFEFDPKLFGTKVYERVNRVNLKVAFRREQFLNNQEIERSIRGSKERLGSIHADQKNQEIEKSILYDKKRGDREVKILLSGKSLAH
jgi:hypothetical protein